MADMLRVRNIPFYMLDIMWSWDRWRHLVETFAAIVGDPKNIPTIMQSLSCGMFEFLFCVAIKHVVFAFRHGGLCNKYE